MKLKIGTDCSGIEAPIQALNKLGIDYEHMFSSDIDKYARQSILANYTPNILYEDITKQRNLPKLDMYVCGFPCQPFSTSGSRLGSQDKRGNIFFNCISTIKQTKTNIFILENVKGIITVQNGEYFKKIQSTLKKLSDYRIYYWLLNTKDYGIPQNRERLFIVGTKKDILTKELNFPKKRKCKPIESYIDKKYTIKEKYCNTFERRKHLFNNGIFVSLGSLYDNSSPVNAKYSSTIITSPLWCIPMHRRATIKECLSLQGFPKQFKQVVSDSQMRKQIGNSMSVNVLELIFEEIFAKLGLSPPDQID